MESKEEKIVLTISSEYLGHWTVYDALRELYQNAFDRANEDKDAKWYHQFDRESSRSKKMSWTIGNVETTLERRTLVLGETSKRDVSSAIGKFGEGYKLAILVLVRNNIDVHIVTQKEVWAFSLEYNEQFKTKMLTVIITPNEFSRANDIEFRLTNVPVGIYNGYTQRNLKLQKSLKYQETEQCQVLLDKRNCGKIFVGSLFVCDYPGTATYGYNFRPNVFQLGRDRNIVDGFHANYAASAAVINAAVDNVEIQTKILDNLDKDDTKYIANYSAAVDALGKVLWEQFIGTNPNSIPYYYNHKQDELKRKYVGIRTVYIEERVYDILIKTKMYKEALATHEQKDPPPRPETVVNEFYDTHYKEMPDKVREAYTKDIMLPAMNWQLED
jgi:hypothetical protein